MVDPSETRVTSARKAFKSIDRASNLIRRICREQGLTLQPTDLASATAGRRVTREERPRILRLDVEGFDPFEWGSHPGLYLFYLSFPNGEHSWTESVNYLGEAGWQTSSHRVSQHAIQSPNPPIMTSNGCWSVTEEQACDIMRSIVNFYRST